jgi:hypothetical protein
MKLHGASVGGHNVYEYSPCFPTFFWVLSSCFPACSQPVIPWYVNIPSGNQTWQWTIPQKKLISSWETHLNMGDVPAMAMIMIDYD